MGRPVMLGNGQLTVGLNEHGLVHDFYYPYVGLDNLTTARSVHHEIGVWINGIFSWVADGTWDITVNSELDALVSDVTMTSEKLMVELHFSDFVDSNVNALCRRVTVKNLDSDTREIRLFMHQVFQISRAGRADTALFVPDEGYILDYKGRCSLLIYGQFENGERYDQYSIGNYGIEGKEGTYRDAEDGMLSNNPVEHGGVDSVLRFVCKLHGNEETNIDYWIVAADSQYSAEKVHRQLKEQGLLHRLDETRDHWHHWLKVAEDRLDTLDPSDVAMAKKSLMVIKAHIDKRGGIIASCDSSIYNYGRDYYSYVWPRDGAYVMWPLIRLGYIQEPRRFFEFCRDILSPDGYLMHKYQPDRAIGSTWHPLIHGDRKELAIQEDETAIVLYMLGEYLSQSGDDMFVSSLYSTFIQPAANFMAEFIDDETGLPHASYDLWEEKFLTTTYTTACVYQALHVAADFADKFEYPDDAVRWRTVANDIAKNASAFFDPERQTLRKGFLLKEDQSLEFDNVIDVSSMYGVMMFADKGFSAEYVPQTVAAIEHYLLDQSPSGGSPRYENDYYFASDPQYLGNPWFVTTLWMAQHYIRDKQLDKARHYIDWTKDKALLSGVLSEQINPTDATPIGVTPLVWSHAEFIDTVLDYARAKAQRSHQ